MFMPAIRLAPKRCFGEGSRRRPAEGRAMPEYAALLRAVNVGGRKLAMADLRTGLTTLGFTGVRTIIQSGNVLFRATRTSPPALERRIEAFVGGSLGIETDVFVRELAELQDAIAANPFRAEAASDPGRLLVMFLRAAPGPDAIDRARAAVRGRERIELTGRHAYVTYPDGAGASTLTNVVLERALGVRGTARNWNTVAKLVTGLTGADAETVRGRKAPSG
jgi:uncharacterized protein (DUF1697 family)